MVIPMVIRSFVTVIVSLGCVIFAQGTRYQYDQLSRLTRVSYADGTTIAYTYDSAGNRLSQVITNLTVPAPKVSVDKTSLSFSAAAGQPSIATQMVLIGNDGGGSLQWVAMPLVPWLNVAPGSGANSGTITVAASAVDLAPG